MNKQFNDSELRKIFLALVEDFESIPYQPKRLEVRNRLIDSKRIKEYEKYYDVLVSELSWWLKSLSLAEGEADRIKKLFDFYFEAYFPKLPARLELIPLEEHHFRHYDRYLDFPVNDFPNKNRRFDGFALQSGENGDLGKAALLLSLSLLTGFTFLALYYILSRAANSIERFIYDENWLKASLTLASIMAGAAAGACLGYYLIGPLVMYFCIVTLGLSNPFGLAITAVALTSLLMAAVVCLITNTIQNYVSEKVNADALDTLDAARFEITEDQAILLTQKGFDVDRIKLIILALREEMQVSRVPSFFSRLVSSTPATEKIKQNLETIRQLKTGNCSQEDIFALNMKFVLKSAKSPVNDRNLENFSTKDDLTSAKPFI